MLERVVRLADEPMPLIATSSSGNRRGDPGRRPPDAHRVRYPIGGARATTRVPARTPASRRYRETDRATATLVLISASERTRRIASDRGSPADGALGRTRW